MTLPNFLIIGAPRAGTTALHYLLQQHPEIFMSSNKEPHFFAFEDGELDLSCPPDNTTIENLKQRSVLDLNSYEQLFSEVSDEQAIGDASPLYLASPGAPRRIKALLPSAKIIAILRNPVDRAYSHFLQNTRGSSQILPDFPALLSDRALSSYAHRKKEYYVGLSLYYDALMHFFDVFERENVRVYLFEDFKQNSDLILKDIFQFLGVDASLILDTDKRYNASGVSNIKLVDSLLLRDSAVKTLLKRNLPPFIKSYLSLIQNKVIDLNSTASLKISPDIRCQLLEEYFESDISKLKNLINQDVSVWLKAS